MKKIYVFGHQNPDTDTITSTITMAYLKRELGYKAIPMSLGNINPETEFVLNYFNVKKPKYLNDVRLQIKDISYRSNCFIKGTETLNDTYNYMYTNNITGVPIVDEKNKFMGIITAKNLLKELFKREDDSCIKTSYENIIKAIKGTQLLKFNDEIKGNVMAVSYKSTTFIEEVKIDENNILIVGDRHSVIETAINKKVQLIILVGDAKIKESHLLLAKENKVNIIKTPFDTYKTMKLLETSTYVKELLSNERSYIVYENHYYDEFLKEAEKLQYNNYPIVSNDLTCKGLLRITELSKKNRKQVILVDHNEFEQSAIGIEEAEILEVIDHHKIGSISTNYPINFRNMAVGSTNTIIYYLFNENRVEIPYDIAGLMLSGILSDTLALTSPTTTAKDIEVVKNLEKICNINYKEFAKEMFEAGSSIKGRTLHDLITSDMKEFSSQDNTFAVSQIFTLNEEDILKDKETFIREMETIRKDKELSLIILMITNAISKCSYFIYTDKAKHYLEKAFNTNFIEGQLMSGIVSRKKQVIPQIMEVIE